MISCQQYDYIEIACMYKLPVELVLENGDRFKGVAFDTAYDAQRNECLKLRTKTGVQLVTFSVVTSMRALKENRHFNVVDFIQTNTDQPK